MGIIVRRLVDTLALVPLKNYPILFVLQLRSPHCSTWLLSVSFCMTSNCSWSVSSQLPFSVSSTKFTLKRSPRHDPICFPPTTSSGEQQVPQEDSLGLAAERAQIPLSLGKLTNIEPDSHAYRQKTSFLYFPFILAKLCNKWSAQRYFEGKAIRPGAPWSEKKMKTLSLFVDSRTLSVPFPFTNALLPQRTAWKTSGVT